MSLNGIGYDKEVEGREIKNGLKGSVGLLGRLDDMLEDIARLKFKLEGEPAAANVSSL